MRIIPNCFRFTDTVTVAVSAVLLVLVLVSTTGTIVADETTSNSNLKVNPLSLLRSSHRDQYQRHLQQIQTLQQYHQQSLQDMINALPSLQRTRALSDSNNNKGNMKQRLLQNSTSAPTMMEESICNSDGSVNFNDDDFTINVFDTPNNIFDTSCTCFQENNRDQVFAELQALNESNIPLFVSEFNRLIGELAVISNYTCTNGCESCFSFETNTNKTCGILSVEDSTSVQSREGNFTFQELATLTSDDIVELIEGNARFYTKDCIEYTTAPYSGTLCFSTEFLGIPTENDTLTCNITYDNTLCNSCFIPPADDVDCIMADCTNIDPAALINVCNDTGLVGPFQFFVFTIKDVDNTTFSLGTCDNDGSNVPVATPVAAIPPTEAPIFIDTAGPSLTVVPSFAPVLVTTPTIGNNTNTTNKTNAPVRTPVRAPSANVATPTNPTSDGNYFRFPLTMMLTTLISVPLVTFM